MFITPATTNENTGGFVRIFVLGAGYIGMGIINQSKNSDDSFIASTTTKAKLSLLEKIVDKALILEGVEKEKLTEIFKECDGMIVCAAPRQQNNYEFTYLQTAKAIKSALKGRDKPFYLLYTGSTSVYGDHHGKSVDENSPRLFSSEKEKILCETEDVYLDCTTPSITVCILRLAGIYGPDREIENRAKKLSGLVMAGNGEQPTNHVHRDDILLAVQFCFKNRYAGVYNLANEDHRSRRQLYEAICRRIGVSPPIWGTEKIPEHGSNCCVSNKKICSEGFVFRYPFLEVSS